MNSFGFEIILFLNDFNTLQITPPNSFGMLRDITLEKFDLMKTEFGFLDLDGNSHLITNETEYFQLFNYVSETELKEVVIYVNAGDLLKKKKASRKNSRAKKPNLENGFQGESAVSDDEFSEYYADDHKDLRNLKYNEELRDGLKYTKHGYNKKNTARIEFIKQKKEMQREDMVNREQEKIEKLKKETEENMGDENFGKKNKNRKGNKVTK